MSDDVSMIGHILIGILYGLAGAISAMTAGYGTLVIVLAYALCGMLALTMVMGVALIRDCRDCRDTI